MGYLKGPVGYVAHMLLILHTCLYRFPKMPTSFINVILKYIDDTSI